MIDELTICNLAIKYPNTVDLVREVEKMTIEEFVKRLESEQLSFWAMNAIYYHAKELKEKNND